MSDPDLDTSPEETYEWHTLGGCARCRGMEGFHYGFEPSRPHYKCQCSIRHVDRPDSRPPYYPRITREGFRSEHTPGAHPDGSFLIIHSALIECPDGEDYSVEVTVEVSYREYEAAVFDEPDGYEDWYHEHDSHVMADLQDLAAELCPPPEIV